MKKIFSFLLILSFILLVSCSNDISSENDVEKNVEKVNLIKEELHDYLDLHISKSDGDGYILYKEIKDDEKVSKILELLQKVEWEEAKVLMSRKPDYKMELRNRDPNAAFVPIIFAIWRTPMTKSFEVNIEGRNLYGKLSVSESKILEESLLDIK